MGITKNQRFRLSKEGYDDRDLDRMSFEEASDIIGKLKPYEKQGKISQPEGYKPYEPKKSGFDSQSAYTSYAKDLCITMLETHREARKISLQRFDEKKIELKDVIEPIGVDELMSSAAECIVLAKNRFK